MKANVNPLINDSIEKEIQLTPEGRTKKFRNLDSLFGYIKNEKEFWNHCNKGKLSGIIKYYQQLLNQSSTLEHIINKEKNSDLTYEDLNHQTATIQQFNRLIKQRNPFVISSMTTLGKQLKKLYEENPDTADGFFSYYLSDGSRIENTFHLRGAIQAHFFKYEFKHLTEEKESLYEDMTNFFQEYQKDISTMQNEYNNLIQSLQNKNDEETTNLIKKHQDLNKEIDTAYKEKIDNLTDLEKLYKEKLRLEGPAVATGAKLQEITGMKLQTPA